MTVDRRTFAAARVWAVARMPYLAGALFACELHDAPGSGTVAVDRRWRVLADPTVVEALGVEQLGRLLIHLCSHLIRDHAGRADRLGVGDGQRARWNRAADAEINDDLVSDMAVGLSSGRAGSASFAGRLWVGRCGGAPGSVSALPV